MECKIDDCTRRATSRGLCNRHYQRQMKYGNPLAGGPFRQTKIQSREELVATRRAYYQNHKPQHKESKDRWKRTHPDWTRKIQTPGWSERRRMTAPRPCPPVCEVCGRPPGQRRLHFDHDHTTGLFRGWLCSGCNIALGHVQDDPAILRALVLYLESWYKEVHDPTAMESVPVAQP